MTDRENEDQVASRVAWCLTGDITGRRVRFLAEPNMVGVVVAQDRNGCAIRWTGTSGTSYLYHDQFEFL
jgi:hypothetical protein